MTDRLVAGPREQEFEVTPIELLFDLVFAFAMTQLSHHLATHLSWGGVAETLVLLAAIYAVWSHTSWAATLIAATERRTAWMLGIVMVFGLFMIAAVPRAFAESGWAFAVPLLLIQVGRSTWTLAHAETPIYRDHYLRVLLWHIVTLPFWLLGATTTPEARLPWWALAVGIDQIGTWLAHPVPGRLPRFEHVDFAGSHMLERCRLFLLIALGETILDTGAAIAEATWTVTTLVAGAAALTVTVELWALAFGRAGRLVQRHVEATTNPVDASRHAMNSLLPMVAGLIAVAIAFEHANKHPLEGATNEFSLLLYGGLILFLLAQGWYLRYVLRLQPRRQVVGCCALVVVGVVALNSSAVFGLLAIAVVLGGLLLINHPLLVQPGSRSA